ncbi:MurR/RpiR family transcriptional regulator [bacterium C-53]|nr:MurR/RpiR family transcriptional regulator [Lachnospiraceae bacterium]NBI01785.1 MurR/RpiR family transcriptional regulator [Lachnospiraceae bacterium]RKJ12202.1 MurR/RpiR family transcriptional regulator [bacterium C-53]
MGRTNDLISKMNELYANMSKGHKAIASYLSDHYDHAAFMTAARLGKEVGVSESTVVRFAMSLGFEGYPQFQDGLQEIVKGKLTTVEKMSVKYGKSSQSEILTSVLRADIEKIGDTLETLDPIAFEAAVDTIVEARNIYVIGIRSCAPLANFLSFYLNIMFGNVHLVQTTSISEVFEQMIRIDEKDVVIGISFPRYSMRTLKAMEFANNRNSKVITITDSVHSPMNLYSSCNLLARSDSVSIVDSLVAPLSLINALVVALCLKRQNEVVDNLEMLEQLWGDYQVYGSDEINFLNEDAVRNFPNTLK